MAGNLPIGLAGLRAGPPSNIPTGVRLSAMGTIYVSLDIENAICKITKK